MQLTVYIIACLGALFLTGSAVAWWRIYRDPRDDLLLDRPQSARVKPAARLTGLALLFSGTAAIGAVAEWFLGEMLVY